MQEPKSQIQHLPLPVPYQLEVIHAYTSPGPLIFPTVTKLYGSISFWNLDINHLFSWSKDVLRPEEVQLWHVHVERV